MATNLRRGLKRLYIVLTIGWALFCTIFVPLKFKWDEKDRDLTTWREAVKTCDQHVFEDPDCYKRAMENYQGALESDSFKNFWILPIIGWRLTIPAVLIPPLALFGTDAIVRWIWRGFKSVS
jgi:hypothetical protein